MHYSSHDIVVWMKILSLSDQVLEFIYTPVLTSRERSLRETLNLEKAKGYLISQGVEDAEYVSQRGEAGPLVVETARAHKCDFVLMGGYGQGGFMEVMVGSTLDYVLREFKGPIWVCS